MSYHHRRHTSRHGEHVGRTLTAAPWKTSDVQPFVFKEHCCVDYDTTFDSTLQTRVVGQAIPFNTCNNSAGNPNEATLVDDNILEYGGTTTSSSAVYTALIGFTELVRRLASAVNQANFGQYWVPRIHVDIVMNLIQPPSGGIALPIALFMLPLNPLQLAEFKSVSGATSPYSLSPPFNGGADGQFEGMKQYAHFQFDQKQLTIGMESQGKCHVHGEYDSRRFAGPGYPHSYGFPVTITSTPYRTPTYYTALTGTNIVSPPPYSGGLYWGFYVPKNAIDATGGSGTLRLDFRLTFTVHLDCLFVLTPGLDFLVNQPLKKKGHTGDPPGSLKEADREIEEKEGVVCVSAPSTPTLSLTLGRTASYARSMPPLPQCAQSSPSPLPPSYKGDGGPRTLPAPEGRRR